MKLFDTPFDGLNDIIMGLPLETPIALMGSAGEGKSILATEMAFKMASESKKNILIVKTEKLGSPLHELWANKLKEKYKTDIEVFIERVPTVEKLLNINGYDLEIQSSISKTGKKGKKTIILGEQDVEKSKVRKYIEKKNVGVVIYDSLTTPFNTVIIGGVQNTPGRFDAEETFFQSLCLLFLGTGCAVITVNHISFNPQQPFLKREDKKIKGGKSIHHNHDYIFGLEQSQSKYSLNHRRMWIVRHPILKEYDKYINIWIDDNGWRELSEEALKELKESEKKRIKGE